jgi:hypothetical protein
VGAVIITFAIALGVGLGLGLKPHHPTHSGGSGGTGDDCTPPGGEMCETSGDCFEMFSSCIMACDGFSYCT